MATEALSRRNFLRARLRPKHAPVRPPWTSESSIGTLCTGCGACVGACPENIVSLDAAHRPVLDLRHAECTFCGACAAACAEPVFARDTRPFPHVVAIGTRCLTLSGVMCRTCGDACPEEAIRFAMRLGGPAVPDLSEERCTGCGACIATCPNEAISVVTPSGEVRHAG